MDDPVSWNRRGVSSIVTVWSVLWAQGPQLTSLTLTFLLPAGHCPHIPGLTSRTSGVGRGTFWLQCGTWMRVGKSDTDNEHMCFRDRERCLDHTGSCRGFCFHFTCEANEGQRGQIAHRMPCHPSLMTTKLMHTHISGPFLSLPAVNDLTTLQHFAHRPPPS